MQWLEECCAICFLMCIYVNNEDLPMMKYIQSMVVPQCHLFEISLVCKVQEPNRYSGNLPQSFCVSWCMQII